MNRMLQEVVVRTGRASIHVAIDDLAKSPPPAASSRSSYSYSPRQGIEFSVSDPDIISGSNSEPQRYAQQLSEQPSAQISIPGLKAGTVIKVKAKVLEK